VSSSVLTLYVDSSTTLSSIIREFEDSSSDLVVIEKELEVARPFIYELTDFPHRQSALLIAAGDGEKDIFVKNKLVRSVATALHTCPAANRSSLGAIRLSQVQRSEILTALRMGELKEFQAIAVIDLITLLLIRSAIPITPVSIGKGEWFNPGRGQSRPIAKLTERQEARLKLSLANRANDGFYSVLVLRRLSKPITALSIRLGISPNLITFLSLLIGFYSAYLLSQGQYLFGALAFQLSLIVDCSDGEVARYTRKFSDFGRWFDASTDRVKEYLVYGALAYSASGNIWALAIIVMALQTFRHLSDYTFAAISNARESVLEKRDIHDPDDGFFASQWLGESELKYWIKKILNFPIGERWLVISFLTAITEPEWVFKGMLFFGSVSLAYVTLSRTRRTLTWKRATQSNVVLAQQDSLIFRRSLGGKFEWIAPSVLRLVEFGAICALLLLIGENKFSIATFAILFAIVYHHYDALYRALQNQSTPRWLSRLGLYLEGRILLVALTVTVGLSLEILALYFLTLFLFIASIQWFRQIQAK